MAGYIFAISKEKWGEVCNQNLCNGFFAPFTPLVSHIEMTSRKRKSINKILSATFGDFITMSEGDNVYFLSDRKIYGIGKTIKIGPDCKYDNYIDSSSLLPNNLFIDNYCLSTNDSRSRWFCVFEPNPYLFKKGADMDDVLKYRPQAFKALRAFQNLTFIKIDDEENRALKEYISFINEFSYKELDNNIFPFCKDYHTQLATMDLENYVMDIGKSLNFYDNREFIFSEMLIESFLLQQIKKGQTNIFGNWDYLTHQLIASPFKPLDYIDKIDIFGYRFSSHYEDDPRLITKYLLIEVKKDTVNEESLMQTMQYVDWICSEYASGDYSKIKAFVIGRKTKKGLPEKIQEICQRSFIKETHPVVADKWNDVQIIHYKINENNSFELTLQ